MYLLYIDESANSDSSKDDLTLSVFGLAGLVIVDKYIPKIVEQFIDLKNKYDIPEDWEIHGHEIFSGNGKWSKRLTDDQRRDFCRDLVALLVQRNRIAKGTFVYKKSNFDKSNYLNCLEDLIYDVASFVSKRNTKQVLVIFDEQDHLENSINTAIMKYRHEVYKSLKKSNGRTCRIIDHGFPGKSKYSEFLQMTDFVGYVIRLSLTLQREDDLFRKSHDQRFIDFVDELVEGLSSKVKIKEIKEIKETSYVLV